MSGLIGSIVAFIVGGLAILGLVPHQQIQPVPPLSQDTIAPIVQQTIPQPTTSTLRASPDSGSMAAGGPAFNVTFYAGAIAIGNAIDFGDGSVFGLTARYCSSVACTIDHSYKSPGIYTVKIMTGATCNNPPVGSSPNGYTVGNYCTIPNSAHSIGMTTVSITTEKTNANDLSSPSISVPGMTKYTDADFGFSFWYPSGWVVVQEPVTSSDWNGWYQDGTITKILRASDPANKFSGVTIHEFRSSGLSITELGATKSASPVGVDMKYYFNATTHTWMYAASGGNIPAPFTKEADISNNTMGGLHIFWGAQRFQNNSIVPLSARNFVVVMSNDAGSHIHEYVEKTIVATDPAVATPVSATEQIKVIQAEKDAYAGQ